MDYDGNIEFETFGDDGDGDGDDGDVEYFFAGGGVWDGEEDEEDEFDDEF